MAATRPQPDRRLRTRSATVGLYGLDHVPGAGRLPVCLRVLLEGALRAGDDESVRVLSGGAAGDGEAPGVLAFRPARVILQDYSGQPALLDIAALRERATALGAPVESLRPVVPTDLVVDHSLAVDHHGTADARERNNDIDHHRNAERYRFLKWAEGSLDGLRVVPPGAGIIHQVNLERLARVVDVRDGVALPDSCVGTDSHTTMVNGLGVLGWGVGGIEATSVMLGAPIELPRPAVLGVELVGALRPGVTASDLVLTVTETLRAHGVVGRFVEFTGDGLGAVGAADRATVANMSPEFGSTSAFFPVDDETLRYLRLTGRDPDHVDLVERYAREQGLWHDPSVERDYDDRLVLDLDGVEPSVAGPRRPQDRIALVDLAPRVVEHLADARERRGTDAVASDPTGVPDGAVAVAAITSCTTTSNPEMMITAGLVARRAAARGMTVPAWVKTSLAPGSPTVERYLERAGLLAPLGELGFHVVGHGCTTCIGNSGPLTATAAAAARSTTDRPVLAAVLSGNRNFPGRVHADVDLSYLVAPALVVAFALAGRVDRDLRREPLGVDAAGGPVHLADLWPTPEEIRAARDACLAPEVFDLADDEVRGDRRWRALTAPASSTFDWDPDSTYLRPSPFVADAPLQASPPADVRGARVLLALGDSVTTDHISPAGRIPDDGPAGRWLRDRGVPAADLNAYGARRGNHDVLLRGGFTNAGLENALVPGRRGGWTRDLTADGEVVPVHDAAARYRAAGVPLVILAGREYGTGSSRDWAAKVTAGLGVVAVVARSFERIHRGNLVGMGVLPLQLPAGESHESLGIDPGAPLDLLGVAALGDDPAPTTVTLRAGSLEVALTVRLDTPAELDQFRHGGILPALLRSALAGGAVDGDPPGGRETVGVGA